MVGVMIVQYPYFFWAEKCKSACELIEIEIQSSSWFLFSRKMKRALQILLHQVQQSIEFKIPFYGTLSLILYRKVSSKS